MSLEVYFTNMHPNQIFIIEFIIYMSLYINVINSIIFYMFQGIELKLQNRQKIHKTQRDQKLISQNNRQ